MMHGTMNVKNCDIHYLSTCHQQWHTQEFCSGVGVQQIQLRTEDRQNADLGAVAP